VAKFNNSSEEVKNTYETDTIVFKQRSYEKSGVKTVFYPAFPKVVLKQEIEKNGGKEAIIEYKQYLKRVGFFWILNGLQLVIAILSNLFIGSNRLFLGISTFATLILIITSIIFLQKAKRHLADSIWHYNKYVFFNNPS
jgi:hypothetical protein